MVAASMACARHSAERRFGLCVFASLAFKPRGAGGRAEASGFCSSYFYNLSLLRCVFWNVLYAQRAILTTTVQERVPSLVVQRRGSTGRRCNHAGVPVNLCCALVSLRFFEFVWVSERVFAGGPGRVAMDPMLLEDVNVVSLWKSAFYASGHRH